MATAALAPTSRTDDGLLAVAPDVAGLQVAIVNLYFVGMPDAGDRG